MDSTNLTLVTGAADTVIAPRDSITGIDVSRGTRSSVGKGALIGLGVGAATGIILGVAASADESSFLDFGAGDYLKVGLLGGALGAAVGALIGSAHHSERWQPAVLPTVSFQSVGDEDRRVAIGLRIRF
jgi:hypothetical protein